MMNPGPQTRMADNRPVRPWTAPWPGRIGATGLLCALAFAPLSAAADTTASLAPQQDPAAVGGEPPGNECAQMNRRFESLFGRSAAKPPLQRLAALRNAARRIGEDPAGCVRDRLHDLEQTARQALVRFTADGATLAAAALYSCRSVDAALRCEGWAADDSGHIDEFTAPVAIANPGSVKLLITPPYRPRAMRVYFQARNAQAPVPIERGKDGALTMPHAPAKGLVVAIVDEGARGSMIKYVWTVELAGEARP